MTTVLQHYWKVLKVEDAALLEEAGHMVYPIQGLFCLFVSWVPGGEWPLLLYTSTAMMLCPSHLHIDGASWPSTKSTKIISQNKPFIFKLVFCYSHRNLKFSTSRSSFPICWTLYLPSEKGDSGFCPYCLRVYDVTENVSLSKFEFLDRGNNL